MSVQQHLTVAKRLNEWRPTVQEIREYRENYSCGLAEASRELLKRRVLTELQRVADKPMTETEQLLHTVVYALALGDLR